MQLVLRQKPKYIQMVFGRNLPSTHTQNWAIRQGTASGLNFQPCNCSGSGGLVWDTQSTQSGVLGYSAKMRCGKSGKAQRASLSFGTLQWYRGREQGGSGIRGGGGSFLPGSDAPVVPIQHHQRDCQHRLRAPAVEPDIADSRQGQKYNVGRAE